MKQILTRWSDFWSTKARHTYRVPDATTTATGALVTFLTAVASLSTAHLELAELGSPTTYADATVAISGLGSDTWGVLVFEHGIFQWADPQSSLFDTDGILIDSSSGVSALTAAVAANILTPAGDSLGAYLFGYRASR